MAQEKLPLISIVLICRETHNGMIIVYIKDDDTSLQKLPVQQLQIRQRFNPEQEYFIMKKEIYNNETLRDYVLGLIKKDIPSDLYTYI